MESNILCYIRNSFIRKIVCLLFLLINTYAILSIDRIESCLLESSRSNKIDQTRKAPAMFFLHFGDPAVEIFNAINSLDIQRIKNLNKCVQLEDSYLFENSNLGTNGTLIHQGSVTYLSGIFQKLLSDIVLKLKIAATHGIEGAEWKEDVSQLGIRTVQYSSIDTELKMKSKAQLNQERIDKVEVFSIGGEKPKINDENIDINSDEQVKKYMRREPDSVYTMVVSLSNRSEFFGGVILVGKDEKDEQWIAEHHEEEEEEQEGIFDSTWKEKEKDHEDSNNEDDENRIKHPQFNAYHTTIQRYTPELNSVLLIRSESSHGIHKVSRGKLDVLILEFWSYQDAPVGTKVQSVKDASIVINKEEL